MCKLSHLCHPAWQLKHLFAQWVNCLLNGLIAHHTPWVCSCAYGLSQISLPLPGLFFWLLLLHRVLVHAGPRAMSVCSQGSGGWAELCCGLPQAL